MRLRIRSSLMTFSTQELPMNFVGSASRTLQTLLRPSRALSYKCSEIDQRTFCDCSVRYEYSLTRHRPSIIDNRSTNFDELRDTLAWSSEAYFLCKRYGTYFVCSQLFQKLKSLTAGAFPAMMTPRAPTAYGRK